MEPSDEIKTVMRAMYAAEARGDQDYIEQFFSRQAGVLAIGTDPGEWRLGFDTIERVHQAQLQEMGGNLSLEVNEQNAFAEGTVGWSADRVTIRFPSGTGFALRITNVLHREDGQWKIVLAHTSIGITNQETLGQPLTISLND